MAKILSQIPIETGLTIQAWHVTQSIDALTGVDAYDITISGSLTVTGSTYLSNLPNPSETDVVTYDTASGMLGYTSSYELVVRNALTASYVDLNAGTNVIVNRVGTSYYVSSSGLITNAVFHAFTSSYTTGSFTGSFNGNLLGTASNVDLRAGTNITIDRVGTAYYINNISNSANFVSTASFNAFTGSYRTGSFTGSFTGSLLGTASYVNLLAGPNITINQVGASFIISGSPGSGTVDTSSLLITASYQSPGIQFTKGDNSTFTVYIPGAMANRVISWGSNYQIPGGNYRLIVSNSVGSPATPTYLILPTQSYVVGDIIEVAGVGTISNYSVVIDQSRTSEQIISNYSNTTIGAAGYLSVDHRDFLQLTCVEASSTSNVWMVSRYYGSNITAS